MENNKEFRTILTPDKAVFYKECSITGKLYKVEITRDEYNKWEADNSTENLYNILKHHIDEEIEFIISELTPMEKRALYPVTKKQSYKEEEE